MYRELAVHVAQVEGINTELIWQDSKQFSYAASQIAGLWVYHSSPIPEHLQQQVLTILNYYGAWQLQPSVISEHLSELKTK